MTDPTLPLGICIGMAIYWLIDRVHQWLEREPTLDSADHRKDWEL